MVRVTRNDVKIMLLKRQYDESKKHDEKMTEKGILMTKAVTDLRLENSTNRLIIMWIVVLITNKYRVLFTYVCVI